MEEAFPAFPFLPFGKYKSGSILTSSHNRTTMNKLLVLLFFLLGSSALFAQPACPDGELSLIVNIRTDNWGYETSWNITTAQGELLYEVEAGTYSDNTLFQTQVCVPDSTCIAFHIEDSFGDGIVDPGYFLLELEGDTIAFGQDFGDGTIVNFNCQPSQSCDSPLEVTTDIIYSATFDDSWFLFSPDSVGIYDISTCGMNECDTKIWIYDTCEGNGLAEDNAGTIFYDNDQTDCAPQALITSYFIPGATYLIRIGDHEDACPDTTDINFMISYSGPVVGCMDPTSCNYNPLATVDNGECLPQGDPNCPDGPDLLMRQDVLETSIYLSSKFADDECLIEEGCMNGYGMRDIIRFSTRIDNIGELDYYIGEPSTDNTQFTWNNCHNHFHYDGYAEYVLFDENGTEIPIGFKNGFCVIDLGCDTGSAQYGCGNMGISAGCYDEYWSALECQWVDITDIPDGDYTFVTRVNWDNAPDKLGRIEKDSLNNWAQVCIKLDRSSGEVALEINPDCPPYFDCAGTPYGNLQPDCEGICGGTAIKGDLDGNGVQEMIDAQAYVGQVLSEGLEATPCNDLSGDGNISVYDAALLASCLNYGKEHDHDGEGLHDHCQFPAGINNTLDTAWITILDNNPEEQYIDIGLKNPTAYINAYQFGIEGLMVLNVESLADDQIYDIEPYNNLTGSTIVGISYDGLLLEKSADFQPLCRIYYASTTADTICLTDFVDGVNHNYEKVTSVSDYSCVELVTTNTEDIDMAASVLVSPNPFRNKAIVNFPNPNGLAHQLLLMDANGQVLRQYDDINTDHLLIERNDLPKGVYFYRLSSAKGQAFGKLCIQ